MATKFVSDLPCHPGEYVDEELEARGLGKRELALQLGKSYSALNNLLLGKSALSVDTALGLERLWGISAETWLSLQQAYDLTMARKRYAAV